MKCTLALIAVLAVPSLAFAQPTPTPPKQPTPKPTAPASPGVNGGEPEFVVTEAGREPRRELRLSPVVGTVERLELTSITKRVSKANGFPGESVNATAKITLRAEVVSETKDGFEVALEVLGVTGQLPDDAEASTKPRPDEYAKAKGAKGTLTLTPFATAAGVRFENAGAPEPVQRALAHAQGCLEELLRYPLPAEEVGAGGAWSIRVPTETPGAATGTPTATVEIKLRVQGLTKDRFTVAGTAPTPSMGAEAQRGAPGMDVTVHTDKGTLTSEVQVVAGRALPVTASSVVKHVLEMTAKQGGREMRASTNMERSVTLKVVQSTPPKPAGK